MSSTPNPAAEAAVPIVLDLDHLHEQTLGDGALEADLLALFSRQAQSVIAALTADGADADGAPSRRADLLHLLCGSARAIGAWDVALRAQTLEGEARRAPAVPHHFEEGVTALAHAVGRVCETIDRRQGVTRR